MGAVQTFVVDREGWDHAEMVEVCRVVLDAARATADEFESDVPATDPDWPAEVLAAAEVLRAAAVRQGRVESGGYAQTGLLPAASDETWAAFVTFAPWAYDASVWDREGRDIVSLADEGHSIVVRLDGPQLESLGRVIGAARLVPEKTWRKVRKERRKR